MKKPTKSEKQQAEALVGKFVNFFIGCDDATPIYVMGATSDGMVTLEGRPGKYAPGIFVVVEPPAKRKFA